MDTVKRVISGIINFISIAIIIVAIYVLFVAINTKSGDAPQIFGYSAFRVMTGSMEPELPVDSFIVVKTVDPKELQVGDVISFYSKDEQISGMVNTHRIVEIGENESGRYFSTKGDANHVVDEQPVLESEIIGKVVWSSLLVGKLVRLASNPLVFFPIVLLPLVIVLVSNVAQTIRIAKDLEREEMEETLGDTKNILKDDAGDDSGTMDATKDAFLDKTRHIQ